MIDNKDRLLLNRFIFVSVLIAFYIGFRMPNLWSVNYYIPSAFDGFYRRSLVGTLLYVFGELRFDYYFIVTLQLTVFTALLAIIFRYACRASIPLKIMVVLYFLAPTGGYFFHEIGYIDQLLYLLLFGVLCSSNKVLKLGLMTASLFIHEEALFTIVPIYLAYLIINKENIKYIATNFLVLALTFFIIFVFFKAVPEEHIAKFIHDASSSASYKFRVDYYIIFGLDFLKSQTLNLHYDQAFLYLPLSLIFVMSALIGSLFTDKKNSLVCNILRFVSVICACISPLLLGFIGVDTSRWIFLSFSSCLIMLFLHPGHISVRPLYSIIFVFALFCRFGELEYFDNYSPRSMNQPASIIEFWRHDLGHLLSTVPVR